MKWRENKLKIKDLKPAEYNPRTLTKKNREQIKTSIEKFGLAIPLVVNADLTIIGGHQRFEIAKEKGDTEITAFVPERQLTKREEQELNIKLNKLGGDFDIKKLQEMGMKSKELIDIGFSPVDTVEDIQYDFNQLQSLQVEIESRKYMEILEKLAGETIEDALEKKLL